MSEQELVHLTRVGDWLISTISKVIASMPPEARGISGMARWLGVHKATCQRVVEGVQLSEGGLTAFIRFPGVRALRQFLSTCESRGVDAEVVAAARAAVDQFAQVLEQHDVSQRGLVDLIASMRARGTQVGGGEQAGGPGEDSLARKRSEEQRRALFGASRGLTGEEVELKAAVAVMWRSPIERDRVRVAVISSLRGIHRQRTARPIVPFILSGPETHPTNRGEARATDATTHALIERFSSTAVRTVKLPSGHARTLLVADTDGSPVRGHSGLDVTVMFRSDTPLNPLAHRDARLSAAVRIVQPTRQLVSRVYIHRSLLASARADVGVYSMAAPPGDGPSGSPDECWYERFPESPVVGVLDESTIVREHSRERDHPTTRFGFGADGVSRWVAALSTYVFGTNSLREQDFRAFEVRERYPVWQTEYRVSFDEARVPVGGDDSDGSRIVVVDREQRRVTE